MEKNIQKTNAGLPDLRWINGNGLKMIAIITMLIDHIGAAILEVAFMKQPGLSSEAWQHYYDIYIVLRMIGRVSFPIFCFLLVEGFFHTRDVKKYASRLLAFAILSEIPFDLAFFDTWMYPGHQNIFFTLFLGLAAMAGIERYRGNIWKQAVFVVAASGAAFLLKTDYGSFGICLILLLYVLRDQPVMQTVAGCLYLASSQMWPVVFAFVPIRMYNGARGRWNLKYIFYAFYPVHLLILWIVREVML